MKKTIVGMAMAAACAIVPMAAQATVFQFNASLKQANEIGVVGVASPATGIAILSYNDFGTLSVADDTYDFAMSVFSLTGPATAYHIHGAATTSENAPVRVGLDGAAFTHLVSGGTLLVGGVGLSGAFSIPATPASAFNAGHPAMSFLEMLRGGLGYVNVHTALNPGGEVRGQLVEVAAVPEPETYAMLLAGLGLVGWIGARRRAAMR